MSKKAVINVGIVGLGRSGWNLHVSSLRSHPKYKIIAVCDIDGKRLQEADRELGAKGYNDYSAFLQHPGLELVVIASPSKDHTWMAQEAMDRGLDVVLEKPIALLLKDALHLKNCAEQTGRILCPYYNFRFSHLFILIRSILSQGLIGKPHLIRRQVGYFNQRDDWQSLLSEGGGIVNAAAIHHVDEVIQLIGQTPSVKWYDMRHLVSKGDTPDYIKIILGFPNGCIADVEVSWVEALPGCGWLIYGTHGSLRFYAKSLTVRWFVEDGVSSGLPQDRSYYSGENIPWQERTYSVEEGFASDYYDQLAIALTANGLLPVTLESAIDTMAIIENFQKIKEG